MIYTISANQVGTLAPGVPASTLSAVAQGINDAAAKFGINLSNRRLRYFVAQTLFETLNYTHWEENLYYSTAQRLCAVWPTRFSMDGSGGKANANDYLCNPQKLGNFVYGSRLGNVNVNDGFKYRGRGAIEITGLTNYAGYSNDVYGDLRVLDNPGMVALPEDAFMSAGWFWSKNNLNTLADTDSFTAATKVINGSTVTVSDRLKVLNKVNAVLGMA